jgi:hypothetical protein
MTEKMRLATISACYSTKKLGKKIEEKLQQCGGAPIRTRNLRITKGFMVKTIKEKMGNREDQ